MSTLPPLPVWLAIVAFIARLSSPSAAVAQVPEDMVHMPGGTYPIRKLFAVLIPNLDAVFNSLPTSRKKSSA